MQAAVTFFDLDKIADSGQCFRWEKLGRRHYRIPAMGKLLTIYQPAPNLIEADCTLEAWDQTWQSYFDLDTDYNAIRDAIDPEDYYLRAAASEAEGIRILRQDLWETMASFIISQNNNIIFKGSGFHTTDYRSGDYQKKAANEGGSAAKGSDGKKETSAGSSASSAAAVASSKIESKAS